MKDSCRAPKSVLLALFVAVGLASQPRQAAADQAWLTSVDEAVAEAQKSGRSILVDLWADWCTWCKKLDENVFSTTEFQDYAQRYVLLRVDTEDGGEGSRLKQRFRVDSLPTTLIVTADMVKVGELKGYLETGPFIQSLELERAMFSLLIKAYQEDSHGHPETVKMLADDLHDRHDGVRAAALYRQILVDSEFDSEAAWNRYLLADSLRMQGAWDEALLAREQAHAAALELEDEELIELTDLLIYQIERDGGRCAEAESALLGFLSKHPGGRHEEEARKALGAIRRDGKCA
jgi:thioredoxin-related protein